MIGNLTTRHIVIEDGAHFKGTIDIDSKQTDSKVDKAVTRAASASA